MCGTLWLYKDFFAKQVWSHDTTTTTLERSHTFLSPLGVLYSCATCSHWTGKKGQKSVAPDRPSDSCLHWKPFKRELDLTTGDYLFFLIYFFCFVCLDVVVGAGYRKCAFTRRRSPKTYISSLWSHSNYPFLWIPHFAAFYSLLMLLLRRKIHFFH